MPRVSSRRRHWLGCRVSRLAVWRHTKPHTSTLITLNSAEPASVSLANVGDGKLDPVSSDESMYSANE